MTFPFPVEGVDVPLSAFVPHIDKTRKKLIRSSLSMAGLNSAPMTM